MSREYSDKRGKWKPRVLKRYALFQLLTIFILTLLYFLINEYYPIPFILFILFLFIWVTKDIFLYPFTWKAYDVKTASGEQALIGETGIVIKNLDPEGHIMIRGEIWKAHILSGKSTIKKGSRVTVVKAEGLKLYVVRETEI